MTQPVKLVNEAAQVYSFSRRAILLGGVQGLVGLGLAGRMAWLAIAENERYQLLAESNRVNMSLVPPRRGWIVDRNGVPIAANRTDFRVDLIPDKLEDKDRVLALLRELLRLAPEEMARISNDLKGAAGFAPVPVAEGLDWERYAAVQVRQPELPGVAPSRGYSRLYPTGAAVAHLTGYVGAASAEQFEESKDLLLVTPGYKVGKDGLEKALERNLRGTPGARRVEVTARGRLVRELANRPDVPGRTQKLTIDIGLQAYAARRLGTNSGSCVVIDTLTGDILAMVSMPAYDPNSFTNGISKLEWKMLSENDHVPLMNKVMQGLYPPGSTVKPMNGLALLAAGVSPEATVTCAGALKLGTSTFHCWSRGGHGAINLHRAIPQSCDIYFYEMARRVGYDKIAPVARMLGLGQKFDLPFGSQKYGTMPDSAWKMRRYQQEWTVADSMNASIGQGYVLVNPLQLAVMAARIASGRHLKPRIVLDGPREQAPALPIPPEHLQIVHDAMKAAVNGGGTAGGARLQLPDVQLSAKTGTAQVRRITTEERASGVKTNASLPFKLRDHALFVCFGPSDNPRYAGALVLEHNGHLNTTLDGPSTARDIITYLFDKQKALDALAAVETGWGGDIGTRMAKEASDFRIASGLPPVDAALTATDATAPTAAPSVEAAVDAANTTAADVASSNPAEAGSFENGQ